MKSSFYFFNLINEIDIYDTSIYVIIYEDDRRKEYFIISNIIYNYIS